MKFEDIKVGCMLTCNQDVFVVGDQPSMEYLGHFIDARGTMVVLEFRKVKNPVLRRSRVDRLDGGPRVDHQHALDVKVLSPNGPGSVIIRESDLNNWEIISETW